VIQTGARLEPKKLDRREREPWVKKMRCPSCGRKSTFKKVGGEVICQSCGRAI